MNPGKTGREPLAMVEYGKEILGDRKWFIRVNGQLGPLFLTKGDVDIDARHINTANSASIKQAVNAKLDLLDKLFTEHRYMDTAHSGYSPERLQRAIAWKNAAEVIRKLKED